MHKQLYEVPVTFAARARYRKEDYERAYAESIRDPEGFWGRMASASTGAAVHEGEGRQLRRARLPHRCTTTASSTFRTTASTATWQRAATRRRSSTKATTRSLAARHLP